MIILFFLFSQVEAAETIRLEPAEHGRIATFETNRYGHFLYDVQGRGFHWSLNGKLIFAVNRQDLATEAMYPVSGGYAVTWLNWKDRTFGIDVVSPHGDILQSLPGYLSLWYFELHGRLYGSAHRWTPAETQVVPIAVHGGKLATSEVRGDFFIPESHNIPIDPDFKRVWAVEKEAGFYLATPLEPTIYHYESLEHFHEKITLPIPWTPWRSRYRKSEHTSRLAWAKSFNRIVYFGKTFDDTLVVAVEQLDGQTTRVYWISSGKKVRHTDVTGWAMRGKIVSGTDGARVHIFEPDLLTVIRLSY